MKIIHIGKYKTESANGVNTVIYNLASRQIELGYCVAIIDISSKFDYFEKKIIDGIEVVNVPIGRLNGWSINKNLRKYIVEQRANVIYHFHSVYISYNFALSSFLIRNSINYILTPHGGYFSKRRSVRDRILKNIYEVFVEKKIIVNAKKIHLLTKHELLSQKYLKASNCFFLPNGMSNIEKKSTNKIVGSNNYICYCGRMDIKHKGLDILLESFNKYISQSNDNHLKLLLIGPGERKDLEVLKKYISGKNLNKLVELTGPKYGAEKNKLIMNSKFYIQTPRWEGLPMSILEAMNLGTPILCGQYANFDYWMKKYRFGCVSEMKTTAIADNIAEFSRYLDSEENRNSELENMYEALANEFEWSEINKKLCQQYDSIMKKSK